MTTRLETTTPSGPIGLREPVYPPTTAARDSGQLVGSTLDGRYRLDGVVGRGGMGVVYEAFDTRLGRTVAVKVLNEAGGANEVRVVREVRTLAHLSHPNLVRVLDARLGPRPTS